MRISTIRNWQPEGFQGLATDLAARAKSSQQVHDKLVDIAGGLDRFSSEAVESIKTRYNNGAADLQVEATVVSLVQRVVDGVAQTAPRIQSNLKGLDESVHKARSTLNEDGSITLPPDATAFEKDIAKNILEPSAKVLLRQATDMDNGATAAFTEAAGTPIPDDHSGPGQQHAPLSVDLEALRVMAKRTADLEDAASAEQSRLDDQIKGKYWVWRAMQSYEPFGDFGGWLDRRRMARSRLLTGLAGSLYQTSSLFEAQELTSAGLIAGALGDAPAAKRRM